MRVDGGGGNVNDLEPNVVWRTTAVVFTATIGSGASPAVLAPGSGALVDETGGTATTRYNIAEGTVAWSVNPDGSYQLDTLDVGFSGPSDRLALADLTLPLCP